MGIIKKLSDENINKIAAGEVIERPVSVVKELVENSIDAGATSITVLIEHGGIEKIQITDNGCGMMREDAEVCFKKHATSKISSFEDIHSIYTMGFRGEALASIATVARVDLYTKRMQDEPGTHVQCDDGKIISVTDEGMPDGTTIIVKKLFYNIPARMKFLKRDATEASYITDIMARFILAHPEISFKYINGKKEVYFSAGDTVLKNSVYTVYGKDYANSVIDVKYKQDYIEVCGVVGKGDTARPNRGYQSFFVNKRYIKSPLIAKAVEEAYKNQIMIGKYPMAVLDVSIDASMIDINFHPTKQEIKFSNENDVFTAVFHAVKNALHSEYSIPKIERTDNDEPIKIDADNLYGQAEPVKPEYSTKIKSPTVTAKNRSTDKEKCFPESYNKQESAMLFERLRTEAICDQDTTDIPTKHIMAQILMEDFARDSKPDIAKAETNAQEEVEPDVLPKEQSDDSVVSQFRIVGQIFSTYIIVESGNEMILIDQHAAHERLKYEELKNELNNKKVSAQDLLFPVTVDLTPVEHEIFIENIDFLNTLGIEADDFGGNSVVVRTAPSYVDYNDIPELLVELIDQISQNKEKPISKKAEYAVYTIACKAAIKANHELNPSELESLVRDIFAIEPINTCPHGRPIKVSMTKKELEKEFKRII